MSKSLQSTNLFASIDMGTNSFKLTIIKFEPSTSKFTTLQQHSCPVILGLNSSTLQSQPFISPQSRVRAIEALTEFHSILRSWDVTRTRVVGTSALRESTNQGEFIKDVEEKFGCGFCVNVISGIEEGRLIYLGVVQFLPVYGKKVLIFDIGGGSSEFVIGENGNVLFCESLRLGHVELTQKFRDGDFVGLMREYVYEQILVSGLVGKVKDLGFEIGIGSSGTIRAIEKAIWCGYGCDEREVLKGGLGRKMWWFSREELRVLVERLCKGLGCEEEKVRRDGFFGRRSEFIVAGAVILDVIMEVFGLSEVRVSGFALGEGVVAEMVSEAFPECDLSGNVRWKSVVRLAMRFNGKDRMKRSVQCASISKEIFEGLKECNDESNGVFLQEKDLEYLEAASMLHNIGLYYGKEGYHKQSCSIITEHGQLDGFSTEEIELIAQFARHHRKKFPGFGCVSLQGYSGEKFRILCSILRTSVVIQKHKKLKQKEIKFSHTREEFVLALVEKEDPKLHTDLQKSVVDDIQRKIAKEAELFEVVYHKKILVVIQKGYVESCAKQ